MTWKSRWTVEISINIDKWSVITDSTMSRRLLRLNRAIFHFSSHILRQLIDHKRSFKALFSLLNKRLLSSAWASSLSTRRCGPRATKSAAQLWRVTSRKQRMRKEKKDLFKIVRVTMKWRDASTSERERRKWKRLKWAEKKTWKTIHWKCAYNLNKRPHSRLIWLWRTQRARA